MSLYKRILVPVDGSSFSAQILPWVAWLCGRTGAASTLLRIVDKGDSKAQAELDALARTGLPGAAAICAAGGGGIARAILDEAARVPDTLVAMTSHGRSGLVRAVLGSTAVDVLRAGGQPMLMFRPHGDERPAAAIERIVVPLDGSELSESMLPLAAQFARWIGARVVVASALDPGAREGFPAGDVQEASYVHARATQLAESAGGLYVGWEVLHGDPREAIARFVRGLPGSMLAMATHGRGALRSAIVGSVTAASLHDSGVPVLTRMSV